ncbi:hypothetical protein [Rheinheimera gaetbuli]
MKKTFSVLLLGALTLSSSMATATPFGEPVDCTTTTTNVPIYGGWAQCSVTHNGETRQLSEYFFETLSPFVQVSDFTTIGGYYGRFSCSATLPFIRMEQVTSQQCKYKPVSGFSVSPRAGSFVLTSSARDYDGSIVNYRWIVNGSVASSSASISLPHIQSEYRNGKWYSRYEVSLEVTDNHGYKNTVSRSLLELNDECRTQACRNR